MTLIPRSKPMPRTWASRPIPRPRTWSPTPRPRTWASRPRPRPRTSHTVLEAPWGQGHVLENSNTATWTQDRENNVNERTASRNIFRGGGAKSPQFVRDGGTELHQIFGGQTSIIGAPQVSCARCHIRSSSSKSQAITLDLLCLFFSAENRQSRDLTEKCRDFGNEFQLSLWIPSCYRLAHTIKHFIVVLDAHLHVVCLPGSGDDRDNFTVQSRSAERHAV